MDSLQTPAWVTVHKRAPWSIVLRVPTHDGPVWFTENVPTLGPEPALLQLLSERVPGRVPTPLGADPERGWLLLADHGPTLRTRSPTTPPGSPPSSRPWPVVEAAIEPWTDLAPARELRDAVPAALLVGVLGRSESWRRAVPPDEPGDYADASTAWLLELVGGANDLG